MDEKATLDILIQNAAQVLTCAAGRGIDLRTGESVGIKNGRIACVAPRDIVRERFDLRSTVVIEAAGKVVLPGFVDCHTHLVFGGDRIDEYAASLEGIDREEMARRGIPTGLAASMASTRAASGEELVAQSLGRLQNMIRSGTTTAEVKSGYGLNTEVELRQLRAIRLLGELQPILLCPTFLGAHAWPPGMSKAGYLDLLIGEMIPRVVAENLAKFCDIWCDEGYYTAGECGRVLRSALEAGLVPKIHAGAYSYIGGEDLAAELGAVSADHLNFTPESALRKLAGAGVVGVLLPGTDFCVNHPRPFRSGPMEDCGLKTALGTNLNPGCWIESMRTAMVLACRGHGMSPERALVAATLHAAMALALEKEIGSLEAGKAADIQIWDTADYRTAIYQIDRNPVELVLKNGEIVVDNRRNQGT
jgi:imidazolonepropionase